MNGIDVLLRDGSTAVIRDAVPADAAAATAMITHRRSADGQPGPGHGPDAAAIGHLLASAGTASATTALAGEIQGRLAAVAVARRNPADPRRADVTFVVADEAGGRGLGTAMLEALARRARAGGVEQFEADVPSADERAMRVLLDSGFDLRRELDEGVFHVALDLRETARHETLAAARAQTSTAASIRPFFEPRSVAVVGAGRERGKIGAEILHNLVATGFTGRLFAVHPSAADIGGVPAVPRVTEIPGDLDLAVIAVPADRVGQVVDDCILKRVRAIVVISAGFSETSEAGRARERELVAKVRQAGIRMVGPNCLGVLNAHPDVRLNATFSAAFPPAGGVAMSTQSGALGLAILDWARELNIGLSTFVSVGNKADVSGNDLLQYWAEDPHTGLILLYLESFGNPRRFSQIARRVGRRKPIVAVKAGRSQAGARAAASHTGALVSDDAVVDALFRQSGVIRTGTMEELFDVARVLANQPVPRGRRVAIVTNAGGPGIMAADACEAHGLTLPRLDEATRTSLRSFLPPTAAIGNPIDMIASASAEQYERTLAAVLADDNIDAVMAIFIPPLVTRGVDVAAAIRRAADGASGKPVVAVFLSSEPAGPLLGPVPGFAFPEPASIALARAAAYGQWREEPPGAVIEFDDFSTDAARNTVRQILGRGGGWALPEEAFALLSAAGIAAATPIAVADEAAAAAAARRAGYPVALKAAGPDIVHKTELGGVQLGLGDEGAVRAAWREMAARLGTRMTGGTVQPMVSGGVEMLIGAAEDPVFGPVIACASGGVLVEVLADRQLRLAPLTDLDAAAMVDGLRGAVLLRGHRGSPAADEAALREALLRLSALVETCPELAEIEINPLRVLPSGVVALDVRARVEPLRRPPGRRRLQG